MSIPTAEYLKIYGIVDEAKKVLKPYPEMDVDLEEALRMREAVCLTMPDVVFLLRLQNELCEKCGRCCRMQNPINVSKYELERIGKYLHIPYKKLKKKLKLIPKGDGTFDLIGNPCPFLKGNLCSIYPVRPAVCRFYPANYIYMAIAENEPLKLDLKCGVIRKMLAYKLSALAVKIRLEKENPKLAEEIASELRKLWDEFMPNERELEKMPPEEQLAYAERWLKIFRE
jgi:Fe-S-cluster containining protein